MKILWLTNIALPEASVLLKEEALPFGGWLVNASEALSLNSDISLCVAFPNNRFNDIHLLSGEKIKYYTFPSVNKNNLKSIVENPFLEQIIEQFNPDIVHIFGTEFVHTLSMVNVCQKKNIKTIVSIQGLVSIIAKHYMLSLPIIVQNRYTFRDLLKQNNIKGQQREFIKRGKFEIEALKKVKHVIGRTTWDKACSTQINPNVIYHHCNETLRKEFYNHKWDIKRAEKYSIFLSQGSYPIKGLHFMIEAMPLILKVFPQAKLYIGGVDITKSKTLKEKIKLSSYGKYINELIKKYNIQEKVIFTGLLNEQQMCEKYLESNVFVCPSSIENSPNSLGEAMLLGVPCVASDVGGVSDMLKHKEEGFVYQVDAPYMLAHYVCEIFKKDELALRFSENARLHALQTHDSKKNTKRLLEIYKDIL
ncbi:MULTISPECIES: glycosyltransferase family 4 protein [Bacillus]|uniref:glycosyltransferase family 4 protein n=1 Tax=Bacillus TaxID=1386 RepID=UPI000473C823|nr:glycosyltransferase family 4 protein [Bacillus cereus]MBY0016050.1 glycosyltransferase family 4 protein [Bacillus cereus]MDA2061804.1 glycosyltransferase family 4 protein [Bacillus cereus]MDZ4416438.1 glycosyltransferase family 4 protein [Bacillus cereus]MDZ4502282.1 glycosyltransferase family 4 protein [Bacillus cereus]